MPLYKYVTNDIALLILKNREIRFTPPNAFNDPFECLPQFIYDYPSTRLDGCFRFSLNSRCRENIEKTCIEPWNGSNSDNPARTIISELSRSVGILCLSKTQSNLLMWAHYCDKHSGAVIEFDEEHPFFKDVFPVKYKDNRPIYALKDFHEKTVPLADLYVKPSVWKYEDEVRIAKPLKEASVVLDKESNDPKHLFSLPEDCILGVTIGARMPIEKKVEIWMLVKETKISLDIAQIANWEYTLRIAPFKPKGNLESSPFISPDTCDILIASQSQEMK